MPSMFNARDAGNYERLMGRWSRRLAPLFIEQLPHPDSAWLTLAMASTLAGNFTILGSIANLIVLQNAATHGIRIGFWEYFAVGAPLTILTIAIGTLWLSS